MEERSDRRIVSTDERIHGQAKNALVVHGRTPVSQDTPAKTEDSGEIRIQVRDFSHHLETEGAQLRIDKDVTELTKSFRGPTPRRGGGTTNPQERGILTPGQLEKLRRALLAQETIEDAKRPKSHA